MNVCKGLNNSSTYGRAYQNGMVIRPKISQKISPACLRSHARKRIPTPFWELAKSWFYINILVCWSVLHPSKQIIILLKHRKSRILSGRGQVQSPMPTETAALTCRSRWTTMGCSTTVNLTVVNRFGDSRRFIPGPNAYTHTHNSRAKLHIFTVAFLFAFCFCSVTWEGLGRVGEY